MDLDKPLDDLISDKRKTNGGPGGGGRGRGAPRQSRERGAPTPYAVSDTFVKGLDVVRDESHGRV